MLDIIKIFHSELMTNGDIFTFEKHIYGFLHAARLEMFLSQSIPIFSDINGSILFNILFVSMVINDQLSPIRIDRRIGKRG